MKRTILSVIIIALSISPIASQESCDKECDKTRATQEHKASCDKDQPQAEDECCEKEQVQQRREECCEDNTIDEADTGGAKPCCAKMKLKAEIKKTTCPHKRARLKKHLEQLLDLEAEIEKTTCPHKRAALTKELQQRQAETDVLCASADQCSNEEQGEARSAQQTTDSFYSSISEEELDSLERQLDEVVISGKSSSTINSRMTAGQMQRITGDELCRAACCNLAESFTTNASADVTYSDAATGARIIKLLGLSGTYVQMLTELYPNFRGAAMPFGLDYVPGPWMQAISISKGVSSVKHGYEGMTGQIDVEYKKPAVSDLLTANLFGSSHGKVEANADAAINLNDKLSTGLLLHYSNNLLATDHNDDGFLDSPLKEQVNVMNRWHYHSQDYRMQAGARYVYESRTGGQDTRHNNFADPYQIHLTTNRAEAFTKQAFFLDHEKMENIALIISGSYHNQQSKYDRKAYNVKQGNLYASAIYETNLGEAHKLSTGLNVSWDSFDERLDNMKDDFAETVAGIYGEYTYQPSEQLTLVAGLRGDHSSQYGFFVTPRAQVRYAPWSWLVARVSAGKGYRTAHILAENNSLLANSRQMIIAPNLDQEEAWNTGASLGFFIPIAEKELSLQAEWYYTNFINQVIVDMDYNAHQILFYNLDGKSYSHNYQVEATYPFFEGFTMTAAYRYSDVKTTYGGVLKDRPLVSPQKGLITASYKTPQQYVWQFDVTAQVNSGGRMPTPDPINPQWGETFDGYSMLNLMVTKFFKNGSIYLGCDNALDYTQPSPIIDAANPRSDIFDATMIYGPIQGRKFLLGIRYTLP